MESKKESKLGFNIKISSETLEALKSEATKEDNVESIPAKSTQNEEKRIKLCEETSAEINSIEITNITTKTVDNVIEKNVEIEIPVMEKQASEDPAYKDHIHYENDLAIYTDPNTKTQYVWSESSKEWIARTQADPSQENKTSNAENSEGSYGYENNTHTYTDADGVTYLWDTEKNAWFPKVDDEFLAHYQMSYGFNPPDANTSESDIAKKNAERQKLIEEKLEAKRKLPEEPKWFEVSEDHNPNVYVSNLPLDITEEEFLEVMQKCGLVMRDPSTGKMKIKFYTKPNSKQLKGDALCTYIKKESVDLALSILDGYIIRDYKIKVQRAKFELKGEYNPALKPKKKRKKDKEKMKKMQEKLFDWRPEKTHDEIPKHERIVIIKNLFEPSLFDEHVELILEYQQDMRDECSKCGEVKKVVIYDMHPEGVAQVTMKEVEDAQNVVKLINGRWFGKRQLTAEIWDGKTKYKMEETAADINKRLDKWNEFLENPDEETSKETDASTEIKGVETT